MSTSRMSGRNNDNDYIAEVDDDGTLILDLHATTMIGG